VRIPIPDQDKMRQMIISACTTDDLDRLAADIAEAHRAHAPDHEVQALYRRFTELQKATAQHADLLSTSLDDTDAALKLVNLQLAGLLAAAGDD
jgi:ABC-type Fe2+-enterobactin transport system substrate-binding protein